MAPPFFFNYASRDRDRYFERFFENLSEEVQSKGGESFAGFLDSEAIPRGAEWDPTIVGALMQAHALVSLVSPAYLNSDYCAKEFALFAHRTRNAAGPPRIRPILWELPTREFVDTLPPPLKALQVKTGAATSVINTHGLRYVVKQVTKYEAEYNDFVDALAAEIIATVKAPAVQPLASVPILANTTPLWKVGGGSGSSTPAAVPAGQMSARFVYIAAPPGKLPPNRPRDPYERIGASDWKPFWPEPDEVHPFLQHIASAPGVKFSSSELPFSANLNRDIEAAWTSRSVVVVVVDPWSVYWDIQTSGSLGYHAELKRLDSTNAVHWCIVIPWNGKDESLNTPTSRAAIESALAQTFQFKGGHAPGYVKSALYYKDNIGSFDELRKAVVDVLHALKEEIKRTAPITRPIPEGPSHSVIVGSGAGA